MSNVIIISPSGNFYGSEQVLYDYLSYTNIEPEVAVPVNSMFENKLRKILSPAQIKPFNLLAIKQLYTGLFRALLTGKYKVVYLNEAGHVKYVLLLARIFQKKKFVIHVRIWEDAKEERWPFKPGRNVTVLAISENIKERLPCNSKLVYDPFIFTTQIRDVTAAFSKKKINIAIIGRITRTKGIFRLPDILNLLEEKGILNEYHFYLYGDVIEDVVREDWFTGLKKHQQVTLAGFQEKNIVYEKADAILHLSAEEPLGRIFLEAINEELPFIGLNAAGIGEIGKITGLTELLTDPQSGNLTSDLIDMLIEVKEKYNYYLQQVRNKKDSARIFFDARKYCNEIDSLLNT